MIADINPPPLLQWCAVGGLILTLTYCVRALFFSVVQDAPGPLAARFSRFWYLKHVSRGNFHKLNIKLHEQYGMMHPPLGPKAIAHGRLSLTAKRQGPVVRIAPQQFSIDDPNAVKTIYSIGKPFMKASWYSASNDPWGTFPDLFTDRNPTRHASNRRLVANLYSATSLRSMEPGVDECIDIFLERLNELASEGKIFDLQFWMQCYAFDVIGQITVAKRFGFLDRGTDDEDIFGSLAIYLQYCAMVGIYNEVHKPLSWLMSKLPESGFARVGQFTAKQIENGKKERQNAGDSKGGLDFLSRTLELHEKNPAKFVNEAIFGTCITNIGAGSDTTSISLCAIMYNLMNSPGALSKLRDEIDQKLLEIGQSERIPFKDTQAMPYLQACIKEGLRLHPATGLPLARVVPEGGATISGVFFPAGVTVGINSWVAHMNREVFGNDSAVFRPERWLDQSKETISLMESYWMPFGVGSRTCIGKNISLLEINKLVPVLVKRFEFNAIAPEKVRHENFWLVKQKDMMCSIDIRQ